MASAIKIEKQGSTTKLLDDSAARSQSTLIDEKKQLTDKKSNRNLGSGGNLLKVPGLQKGSFDDRIDEQIELTSPSHHDENSSLASYLKGKGLTPSNK